MRAQSWLTGAFCRPASAVYTKSSDHHSDSPTSTSSSSSSSAATTISLQSNLSLQTHPSLPSLQYLAAGDPIVSSSSSAAFLCSATTLRPRPDHHHHLPIICLSLRGNLLYVASGHQIAVYDTATGSLLETFTGGPASGSVKAVSFASDGKLLTAHQDSMIRAWKPSDEGTHRRRHKLLAALPTVADRLRHFAFPSSYVSVRRHKKVLRIQHADAVSALAVNSALIYSVSWDRSLKIWNSTNLRCIESVARAHDDAVNAVAVTTGGTVYTGSADRKIRVWGKPSGANRRHTLIATLEKHKSAVNALTVSDDGSVLFSGSCDRSILVWEREDSANHMAATGALRGHGKAVLCLINVSDLLMSGSADRTVRIWRREEGGNGKYCCLAVLDGQHEKPVKALAGERNEEDGVVSVYSGSLDGDIKVWRVAVRETVKP